MRLRRSLKRDRRATEKPRDAGRLGERLACECGAGKRPLALVVAPVAEERRRVAAALAAAGLDALALDALAPALARLAAQPCALVVIADPGAADACELVRANEPAATFRSSP